MAFSMDTFIASPFAGWDAVSKATNGRSAISLAGYAVTTMSFKRTSFTRSMNDGVGAGGGPPAGTGGGVGVGGGGGAPAAGVAFFGPRISPFRTEGMSVRIDNFPMADRAIPPKIATIGFQIPSPWNSI